MLNLALKIISVIVALALLLFFTVWYYKPAASVNETLVMWDEIKQAIESCEAKMVFQAHSLEVSVTLKNGDVIRGMEPEIDAITKLAASVSDRCGQMIIATE